MNKELQLFRIMERDCKKKNSRGRPAGFYEMTDAAGNKLIVENSKKFCQQNHLNSFNRGSKKKNSRGRPAAFYEITDPAGNTFVVENLKKFCQENHLNSSNIILYANGSKGWKARKLNIAQRMDILPPATVLPHPI